MRFIIHILISVFASQVLNGQASIEGAVKDISGKKISNVTILIDNKGIMLESNEKCQFSISG